MLMKISRHNPSPKFVTNIDVANLRYCHNMHFRDSHEFLLDIHQYQCIRMNLFLYPYAGFLRLHLVTVHLLRLHLVTLQ